MTSYVIDEMRTIVTECNFDIMGISLCETFLDDNVADNEICIEGYTTVKKNRNRHGGGVILYNKEVRIPVVTVSKFGHFLSLHDASVNSAV